MPLKRIAPVVLDRMGGGGRAALLQREKFGALDRMAVGVTSDFHALRRPHSHIFRAPGAFLVTATYEDRFGPLEKIGVLGSRYESGTIQVDMWVMSRAFSRHVEFHMLDRLYKRFDVACIRFSFHPTERNGPWQECFARFFPAGSGKEDLCLLAAAFEQHRPQLFHQVIESSHE